MLSEESKQAIRQELARYPDSRSALMPALYIVQREYGWLPQEAIDQVAELMGLTSTEVGSVASFYTMYYLEQVGHHVVDFCTDLPCALVGAEGAFTRLRDKLGLKDGEETTGGYGITLRPAMCLGGCDRAPVLLLDNEKHYEQMTDEKLEKLLVQLNVGLHKTRR